MEYNGFGQTFIETKSKSIIDYLWLLFRGIILTWSNIRALRAFSDMVLYYDKCLMIFNASMTNLPEITIGMHKSQS